MTDDTATAVKEVKLCFPSLQGENTVTKMGTEMW